MYGMCRECVCLLIWRRLSCVLSTAFSGSCLFSIVTAGQEVVYPPLGRWALNRAEYMVGHEREGERATAWPGVSAEEGSCWVSEFRKLHQDPAPSRSSSRGKYIRGWYSPRASGEDGAGDEHVPQLFGRGSMYCSTRPRLRHSQSHHCPPGHRQPVPQPGMELEQGILWCHTYTHTHTHTHKHTHTHHTHTHTHTHTYTHTNTHTHTHTNIHTHTHTHTNTHTHTHTGRVDHKEEGSKKQRR